MNENGIGVGTLLAGRYEVGQVLGAGGFGATYLARDLARFGTICVVKTLLPIRQADEVCRRLFEREARLLADLSHPQIPKLDAYFEHEGRFVLVLEYVEGETLSSRLQRETRLSEAATREIVLQLLDVLSYLHARTPPVIHRDVKPGNIILARDGRVVLIDFGAVREAIGRDETHTAIGTAGYTPIEQVAGRATPASDCYALGATALHMVSGTHPMDWHDRETGELDIRGKLACSPSFELFLTGTLAGLSTRVRDARAARELLLGGDTVIGPAAVAEAGQRLPRATPVATPTAEPIAMPLSASALFAPAGTVPSAATPAHAVPPVSTASTPAARVAPAPASNTRRLVLGAAAVATAVVAWLVLDGRRDDQPAVGDRAAAGAPAAGQPADAAATRCVQPATVVHRTESQFDVHVLCPAGWQATFVAPVRSSRLTAPDGVTEVWAGVWRPARSDESLDASAERWRTTMAPQLGALTLTVEERPDDATVRMAVVAAGAGRQREGSLQVQRTEVGGNRYLSWSLLLYGDDTHRPMALQVLGSLDYLAPAAAPAGERQP